MTVIDLGGAPEVTAGKVLNFDLWDDNTGIQIGKFFNICAFYHM